MKVVYIDDSDSGLESGSWCESTTSHTGTITLGKVYTVIPLDRNPEDWLSILITNDRGVNQFYFKWRFIPLEEYRENILNSLEI
jgi:hypothetical protein